MKIDVDHKAIKWIAFLVGIVGAMYTIAGIPSIRELFQKKSEVSTEDIPLINFDGIYSNESLQWDFLRFYPDGTVLFTLILKDGKMNEYELIKYISKNWFKEENQNVTYGKYKIIGDSLQVYHIDKQGFTHYLSCKVKSGKLIVNGHYNKSAHYSDPTKFQYIYHFVGF